MASTRNINNPNDYAMRQRLYTGATEYLTYEAFHVADRPALPALYAPSFLPRDVHQFHQFSESCSARLAGQQDTSRDILF